MMAGSFDSTGRLPIPSYRRKVFSMRINVPELVESETGFHIIRVMKLEGSGCGEKSAKCAPRFGNICTKRSYTEKLPAYVKLLLGQAG